jgi:hypothetical protein
MVLGPLAQLVEQLTLNQPVLGSSPKRLTKLFTIRNPDFSRFATHFIAPRFFLFLAICLTISYDFA